MKHESVANIGPTLLYSWGGIVAERGERPGIAASRSGTLVRPSARRTSARHAGMCFTVKRLLV